MFKKVFYLIAVVSAIGALSCSNNVDHSNGNVVLSSAVAKDVLVEEFKSKISYESIVLDVRRSIEFEAGHLENAVNIDFFSPNFVAEVMKLDKSKKLLIYCASGGRSAGAMKKLAHSGFPEMYNMLGGFGAWKKANFKYVK